MFIILIYQFMSLFGCWFSLHSVIECQRYLFGDFAWFAKEDFSLKSYSFHSILLCRSYSTRARSIGLFTVQRSISYPLFAAAYISVHVGLFMFGRGYAGVGSGVPGRSFVHRGPNGTPGIVSQITRNQILSADMIRRRFNLLQAPIHIFAPSEVHLAGTRNLLRGRSGIYLWLNTVNNKAYLGSAYDINDRPYDHLQDKGSTSPHLHAAIDKYGTGVFALCVVEFSLPTTLINNTVLLALETSYLLALYRPLIYNIKYTNTLGISGKNHSEATKLILSEQKRQEKNPSWEGKAPNSQPIEVLDLTDGSVIYFDSIAGASRTLGVKYQSLRNSFYRGHVCIKRYRVTKLEKN